MLLRTLAPHRTRLLSAVPRSLDAARFPTSSISRASPSAPRRIALRLASTKKHGGGGGGGEEGVGGGGGGSSGDRVHPDRALLVVLGLGAASTLTLLLSSSSPSPPSSSSLSPPAAEIAAATTTTTVPVLDGEPTNQLQLHFTADEQELTRILTREAFAHEVKGVPGVLRYHGTRIASNSPVEDHFLHGTFPSPYPPPPGHDPDQSQPQPRPDWMAWAVFDGHGGWQMADHLTRQLIPFVRHHLAAAATTAAATDAATLDAAIRAAFLALDDAVASPAAIAAVARGQDLPFAERAARLALASAGSCALLALYDPETRQLRVANVGDSRAVYGRPSSSSSSSSWAAEALSVDQSGSNEDEAARIRGEHPGEEGIVEGGRVLGVMVSRALGDGRWKWDGALQREIAERYWVKALSERYPLKTPPYLTAEPVVTTTRVGAREEEEERGGRGRGSRGGQSFVILASDGLWDFVSSERAVQLVGGWLEWQEAGRPTGWRGGDGRKDFGRFDVEQEIAKEGGGGGADTFQDDNVAVHLVRNALGGAWHEALAARLTSQVPLSRNMRDDVTVQVVFFDDAGPGQDQRQ